jgi:hypothetical protein
MEALPSLSRPSFSRSRIIFDYVIVMAAQKGKRVGHSQVIGLEGQENVSS